MCVFSSANMSEAERKGEGEREAHPEGIKPKPQDISDLEAERVKHGWRRRERKREESWREGTKRWSEGAREADPLEGYWKAFRILQSNQP